MESDIHLSDDVFGDIHTFGNNKDAFKNPHGDYFGEKNKGERNFSPPKISPAPTAQTINLSKWVDIAQRRIRERNEIFQLPSHIEITHFGNEPVFYALIGDVHLGGNIDYERFKNEILGIRDTPKAYVITVGDLIDNFFYNSAAQENIFNIYEQAYFSQSVFEELKGRLMVAIAGNHELWSNERGLSIYHKFVEEYKAHYMEGLAYITINVFNSKFNLAIAHKYGGYSKHNLTYSAHRLYREQGEGADVVVTAHTHKKAINQQTVKGFGGARQVLFISLGSYKNTDRYSRQKGYPKGEYEEQGGVGLIFYPDKKRVDVFWSILDGINAFRNK